MEATICIAVLNAIICWTACHCFYHIGRRHQIQEDLDLCKKQTDHLICIRALERVQFNMNTWSQS